MELPAGTRAIENYNLWGKEDLGVTTIEDLESVSFDLTIRDSDTYSVISSAEDITIDF